MRTLLMEGRGTAFRDWLEHPRVLWWWPVRPTLSHCEKSTIDGHDLAVYHILPD